MEAIRPKLNDLANMTIQTRKTAKNAIVQQETQAFKVASPKHSASGKERDCEFHRRTVASLYPMVSTITD
jgi:hypothetical protein